MTTETGSFGFAIQKEKGCFTTPDTWLPTLAVEDPLGLRKSYQTYSAQGGYVNRYNETGTWAEGDLFIPLTPGVMANLLSWIQDRDSNNQGRWASLLVDIDGSTSPLKVRDAKVRQAAFFLRPNEPVLCKLSVAGLHAERGKCYHPVMPTAAPYIYKEAEMELATDGGALSTATLGEVTVMADNSIEEAANVPPWGLANCAGVRVTGTINRDLMISAIYADFAEGEEAAMSIELCRGANSLCLSLPRILYTNWLAMLYPVPKLPRQMERVTFIGLGSTDGATPPIVLA